MSLEERGKSLAKQKMKNFAKQKGKAILIKLWPVWAVLLGILLVLLIFETIFGQITGGGTYTGTSMMESVSEDEKLKEDLKKLATEKNYENLYVYKKNNKIIKLNHSLNKENNEWLDKYNREPSYITEWNAIYAFQLFKNMAEGAEAGDLLDMDAYKGIADDLAPLFVYFTGENIDEYYDLVLEPVYEYKPYKVTETIYGYEPVYRRETKYKKMPVMEKKPVYEKVPVIIEQAVKEKVAVKKKRYLYKWGPVGFDPNSGMIIYGNIPVRDENGNHKYVEYTEYEERIKRRPDGSTVYEKVYKRDSKGKVVYENKVKKDSSGKTIYEEVHKKDDKGNLMYEDVEDGYDLVHLTKKELSFHLTWNWADKFWREHDEATGQDMQQILGTFTSHKLDEWGLGKDDVPPKQDWHIGMNDNKIYKRSAKVNSSGNPITKTTHKKVEDLRLGFSVSSSFEIDELQDRKVYKVHALDKTNLYKDESNYLYTKEPVLNADGTQKYDKVVLRDEDGNKVHEEGNDLYYKREWVVVSQSTDHYLALADSIQGSYVFDYNHFEQREEGLWRYTGYEPMGSQLFLKGQNLPEKFKDIVQKDAGSSSSLVPGFINEVKPEVGKWRSKHDRIDSYLRYYLNMAEDDVLANEDIYIPLKHGAYGDKGIVFNNIDSSGMPTDTTELTGSIGEQAAQLSFNYLDRPYILGAQGPNNFDCSGLLIYLYKQLGVELNSRYLAHTFYTYSTKISKSELQLGDLGFIVEPNGRASHVGIYVGDGKFIDASYSKGKVVHRPLNWTSYGRFYIDQEIDGSNTVTVPVNRTFHNEYLGTSVDFERKMLFEAMEGLRKEEIRSDWLFEDNLGIERTYTSSANIPPEIYPALIEISEKYDIPAWFIAGLIQRESSFNITNENSSSGAYGLMQVMPFNWENYGTKLNYDLVTDKDNVLAQLDVGTYILKGYLGEIDWDGDWKEQTLPGLRKFGGYTTAREYPTVLDRVRAVYATKLWNYAESFKAEMTGDIHAFTDGTIWPVAGFMRITSHFGKRTDPITGKPQSNHNGIDIGKNYGSNGNVTQEIFRQPAVAVANGKVIKVSKSNTGYGNSVIIRSGNYDFLYAHLDSISVSTDQAVVIGQELGKVGSTGKSSGPHLHFEVRKKGTMERIDPLNILTRR